MKNKQLITVLFIVYRIHPNNFAIEISRTTRAKPSEK
jgi:predicted transcriptional regulator with HTH domain